MDAPQTQYAEKAGEASVVKRVQEPKVQKSQKFVEAPQTQYSEKVVDVSVEMEVQVPNAQKSQKVVEASQIQHMKKVGGCFKIASLNNRGMVMCAKAKKKKKNK